MFNVGDKYLIQLICNVVVNINMEVEWEEDLVFVSLVWVEFDLGNSGIGKINQGKMLDVCNLFINLLLLLFCLEGELINGLLEVCFVDDGVGNLVFSVFDNNGDVIIDEKFYQVGIFNKLFSENFGDGVEYQGFQFEIFGNLVVGDVFFIDFNENGVFDNCNVEFLVVLGIVNIMNGGIQNFIEGYVGLVEVVGVKICQSQFDSDVGVILLE